MTDPVQFPPFTVTRPAIAAIEQLGGLIQVDLEVGGCCGTYYAFSIPSKPGTDVSRYGCPGAWLLVTRRARTVLAGATLDYAARLKPPRFRVLDNPNTLEHCPCRRSFGQAWPGPSSSECRSYAPMPWDQDYEPPAAWRRRTGWRRS